MILSGPIRPAQLKAFSGVVDFYYDKHGRVIARSWPKASTRANPGLMATAARMAQAWSIRAAADSSWISSWNFSPLPEGRTANDLAQQNLLWQIAASDTPSAVSITHLSRFYRHWLKNPFFWIITQPDWGTLQATHEIYLWPLEDAPTLSPSISYSHQLFRRGDATLRRPILTFPTPTVITSGAGPYPSPQGNWYRIDLPDPTPFIGRVAFRPFWKTAFLRPPTPRTSLCYGEAERPLPAGGLWYITRWIPPA